MESNENIPGLQYFETINTRTKEQSLVLDANKPHLFLKGGSGSDILDEIITNLHTDYHPRALAILVYDCAGKSVKKYTAMRKNGEYQTKHIRSANKIMSGSALVSKLGTLVQTMRARIQIMSEHAHAQTFNQYNLYTIKNTGLGGMMAVSFLVLKNFDILYNRLKESKVRSDILIPLNSIIAEGGNYGMHLCIQAENSINTALPATFNIVET